MKKNGGGGGGGWRLILYFTGGDGTSMNERSENSLPKPPLNTSIGVTTKLFWRGKSTSRKSNAPPPFPNKKVARPHFFLPLLRRKTWFPNRQRWRIWFIYSHSSIRFLGKLRFSFKRILGSMYCRLSVAFGVYAQLFQIFVCAGGILSETSAWVFVRVGGGRIGGV